MPRIVTKNNNDELRWTERVWDPEGTNLTHPLATIVELDRKNGQSIQGPSRKPPWLNASVSEIGLQQEGFVETVEVIVDATALDQADNTTYTFLLRAEDAAGQATDRRVTLTINP